MTQAFSVVISLSVFIIFVVLVVVFLRFVQCIFLFDKRLLKVRSQISKKYLYSSNIFGKQRLELQRFSLVILQCTREKQSLQFTTWVQWTLLIYILNSFSSTYRRKHKKCKTLLQKSKFKKVLYLKISPPHPVEFPGFITG